ncbi:hypothetical protein BD560DRAFT_427639 [Blakeslea trispora]|nr:hypothetical protein BD560DRAFT_427639 [Blakeslea trispora]
MNRQKSSQNGRQNDGQNTAKKQAKYGQKAGERAKSVITKSIRKHHSTSSYSQIQLRVSKFLEKRQNYMTNPKKKKMICKNTIRRKLDEQRLKIDDFSLSSVTQRITVNIVLYMRLC